MENNNNTKFQRRASDRPAASSGDPATAQSLETNNFKRRATDQTHLLIAVEPPVELLVSMALRLDHGFGLLPKEQKIAQLAVMRKLHDEIAGRGYFGPENAEYYAAILAFDTAALPSSIWGRALPDA